MKKFNKVFVILILSFILLTCFVACNENEEFKLEMPTKIAVSGSTLSWAAVENAEGYQVIVDGDTENMKDVKETYLDIAITELRSYEIQVRAYAHNGEEIVYSEYAKYTHTVTSILPTPAVTVTGKQASWTAIQGASDYLVKITNSSNDVIYEAKQTSCTFSFEEADVEEENKKFAKVGRYKINVTANPSAEYSSYTESKEATAYYCVTKILEAPKITGYTSSGVRWDNISNNSGYELKVYYENETEPVNTFTTTSTSYSFSYMDLSREGKYYFIVKAFGDKVSNPVYFDSAYSERDYEKDLTVLKKFDNDVVQLQEDKILEIKIDSISMLKSVEIELRTTTADEKAALYSVNRLEDEPQIYIKDFDIVYAKVDTTTEVFDSSKEYMLAIKNQEEFNTNKTYYVLNDEGKYISQPKITEFDSSKEYYIFEKALGPQGATLTEFIDGVDYFVLEKATYKFDLSTRFLKEEDGKMVATRGDDYYGKMFKIIVSFYAGTDYSIITTKDLTCEKRYLSYKIPNKIDETQSYTESPIGKYFDTQSEYEDFVGKYNGYYAVENLGELQYMSIENTSNYVLMCDIDAKNYAWKPIQSFSGILDGNYKRISNLVYATAAEGKEYAFILNNNGEIKDLFLVNLTTNFNHNVEGDLAGIAIRNNKKITGCYVSGTLKHYSKIAGIASDNTGGNPGEPVAEIQSCQNFATINAITQAAGIAGVNNGKISNSYNAANMTAEKGYVKLGTYEQLIEQYPNPDDDTEEFFYYENSEYKSCGTRKDGNFKNEKDEYYSAYYILLDNMSIAGGVVGVNRGTVELSYSIADIKAKSDNIAYAGGLCAINENTINKSYSGAKFSIDTGKRNVVEAEGKSTAAGGLIGKNENAVNNSYSTIRAKASNNFGGFIGENNGAVSNCYSTGGVDVKQQAENKGPFVGLSGAAATVENCYYHNSFTNETVNNVNENAGATKKPLKEITEEFVLIEGNIFTDASNEKYTEPVLVGMIYADSFEETINPGAGLKQAVYSIEFKISQNVVEITNLAESIESYKIIGDISTKGNAIVVFNVDNARVAINVTVK